MSYDVSLYDRDFLERAISENLGDWRGAPAIPEVARRAIWNDAIQQGFDRGGQDFGDGVEVNLEADEGYAQLSLFKNSVAMTLSLGGEEFERCLQLMQAWADEHGLAFHDPQGEGED